MTRITSFIDSPQSARLWMEPQPIWLWDVAGQRIAWANRACLGFGGAHSMDDLLRLRFRSDAPFIKQLAALAMRKNELEGVRELIRFPVEGGEIVFDCQCEQKEIEPGRAGVLIRLVADLGKVRPEPAKPSKGKGGKKPKKRAKKKAKKSPAKKKEQLGGKQIDLPEKQSASDQTEISPVQILNFEGGHQANGFEVETEKVDEEDLLTLQEIARMINGPIELGAGGRGGQGVVSSLHVDPVDGRPRVATRRRAPDSAGTSNTASSNLQIVGGSGHVSREQADAGQKPGAEQDQGRSSPVVDKPSGKPSARATNEVANERNYFLESLPAALAIAMGGRLMRANEAFLYAFGFGSERELRKAGGLAAVFPQSQNGVLVEEKTGPGGRPAANQRRSARIKTLSVSRTGRKREISLAYRNVSTGREPVQIIILHEESRSPEDDTGRSALFGGPGDASPGDDKNVGQDSIDFLASVSHEVRTPLNSIVGFSELMKDERFGAVDVERFRGYAADIHVSALHALSLINDLLDITKIIAGKHDLDFEAVPVHDVIHEVVSAMRLQAERKGIALAASLEEGLPSLYADRRSIKQILLNLISNAIKFSPRGGDVKIISRREKGGAVALIISDKGVGMREDQIDTALEPFEQLEASHESENHEKGTGLGLPLTKALVMAHHASFRISSTPGLGTSVEISFPPDRLAL